jgi:predicted small secreted protein
MSLERTFFLLLAPLAAATLSACAGVGQDVQQLSLPKLPAPTISSTSQTGPQTNPTPAPVTVDQPVGSATDIYARVAQGAMSCWFGANGPLKKDYIFHANADAPSRGGKAQITIHRRVPTQPNPRGAKAYLVNIDPTGESTATVKAENLKMSDDFASAMTDDVARWSRGDQGCSGNSTAAGWAPAPPAAAVPAATTTRPTKKAKATQPKKSDAYR